MQELPEAINLKCGSIVREKATEWWDDLDYYVEMFLWETEFEDQEPCGMVFYVYYAGTWDGDGPTRQPMLISNDKARQEGLGKMGCVEMKEILACKEAAELAEPQFHGTIKWDGCTDIWFNEQDDNSYTHLCGKKQVDNLAQCLQRIVQRASQFIPSWDGDN